MRPLSAMECFRLKAGSCYYKPAGIQQQRKLMAISAQSSKRSGQLSDYRKRTSVSSPCAAGFAGEDNLRWRMALSLPGSKGY